MKYRYHLTLIVGDRNNTAYMFINSDNEILEMYEIREKLTDEGLKGLSFMVVNISKTINN